MKRGGEEGQENKISEIEGGIKRKWRRNWKKKNTEELLRKHVIISSVKVCKKNDYDTFQRR